MDNWRWVGDHALAVLGRPRRGIIGETTPWHYWGDHAVALLGRPRRGGGPTDNYPIL
ncbi:MAG: hypothetical protein AAFU33_15830 [Bacteroidota bacterium]